MKIPHESKWEESNEKHTAGGIAQAPQEICKGSVGIFRRKTQALSHGTRGRRKSLAVPVCSQKTAKERVPKIVDSTDKRRCKVERNYIFKIDEFS